jgi:hypothetical protein
MAGFTAPVQIDIRPGRTLFQGMTPPTTVPDWLAKVEGTLLKFKSRGAATTVGAEAVNDNEECFYRLVRNDSGVTLAGGHLCSWKSAYYGKRVDGYTTVSYATAAGVIDPLLTSVVDDDYFLLQVSGPCLCKNSVEAAAEAHIDLHSDNVFLLACTAATSQGTAAGRVAQHVVTNATQAANIVGVALSAKTSAQTNNSILVYLTLLKA